MSILLREEVNYSSPIEQEIINHPAWHGSVSGLAAEKILRGRKAPYLYLLRAGEGEMNYYVTFILPDLSIMHQPFVITVSEEGWYFEQGAWGGPFTAATPIDDVLHLIMHCGKGSNSPRVFKN